MSLRSVLSAWLHRSRMESELDSEIREHIQTRADDLERSGLPRPEAERRARMEFGAAQRIKEECRDASGTNILEVLLQDARFTARTLRQSPGFTAVAILTVALGIGANTAIFSVVYAALLRPLPYSQPDRLITIGEVRAQQNQSNQTTAPFWEASYPDYLDWTKQSTAFQSLGGVNADGFTLRGLGEPEPIPAAMVSASFFPTLGVQPLLGRNFSPSEEIPTGPSVVMLTYGFWKTRFNGDPNVIGRAIQLDANTVTIVGVLPREFQFAPQGGAQIWVPLHMGQVLATRRNLRWFSVVGRLAPGITAAQARTEMETINQRLASAYPEQNGAIRLMLVPLRDRIVGRVEPLLLILFGAAGFVLLIACANVANLLMARASRRRREFAIRSALGAGRGRMIAQLLTESLMLATLGGAIGFAIAYWGTSLLISAIPSTLLRSLPFLRDASSDPMVLAFLASAVLLTGVAFGIIPALEVSDRGTASVLKEETRSSSGARTRLRDVLVIAQIAVSLMLLVGAGLLLKSLTSLLNRDPGFNAKNLLTFSVALPATAYPQPPDLARFDREFTQRLRKAPGIFAVATSSGIPLSGSGSTIRFVIEGKPVEPGQESETKIRTISPNYFSMMGIPLSAGRFFNDVDDTPSAPNRVIVNRAWAKRYLPGEDPVGKRVRFTYSKTQPYREIVGLVADTADTGLDSADEPILFTSSSQGAGNFMTYIVRTSIDAGSLIPATRGAMRDQDPQLVMIQPIAMEQIIAQSPSVFMRRYPSLLIGSFAGLALILAIIGLYGLISYSVSQRTREVGIRIALGAQRGDVLRMVVRDGLRLTSIGIGLGLLAAVGFAQLMRSLLFGVSAIDPATFIGVAALLALVAFAACCVPATRAMRTDPVIALRYE